MYLLIAIVGVVLGTCLLQGARAEEFRAADNLPGGFQTGQAFDYMEHQLREHTGHKHNFRVWHGGEQGTERFLVERVRAGMLDLARVDLASFGSLVPSTALLSTSLLHPSDKQFRAAFEGPIGQAVLRDLEQAGFIGLCFYRAGANSFYSSARPVRQVADLRGLRLRVAQRTAWSAALESLGAKPRMIPFDMIPASFGAEVIDSSEGSMALYAAARHFDVAKHFSLTQHAATASIVVFSRQIWERLSPDTKAAMAKSAQESAAYFDTLVEGSEESGLRNAEAAGIKIVTDVDRAGIRRALKAAYLSNLNDHRTIGLVELAARLGE